MSAGTKRRKPATSHSNRPSKSTNEYKTLINPETGHKHEIGFRYKTFVAGVEELAIRLGVHKELRAVKSKKGVSVAARIVETEPGRFGIIAYRHGGGLPDRWELLEAAKKPGVEALLWEYLAAWAPKDHRIRWEYPQRGGVSWRM